MEHQRTRPLVGNGLIHRHHARLLSNGGLEQQVPERSISYPFVGVIIAPSPATENLSIYSRRRQAARKAASMLKSQGVARRGWASFPQGHDGTLELGYRLSTTPDEIIVGHRSGDTFDRHLAPTVPAGAESLAGGQARPMLNPESE